jgi:hypothetical protein
MLANYEAAGVHASRVGYHISRSLRLPLPYSQKKLQLANNIVKRCFETALLLVVNVASKKCYRTGCCFGFPLPSVNVASGYRCHLRTLPRDTAALSLHRGWHMACGALSSDVCHCDATMNRI